MEYYAAIEAGGTKFVVAIGDKNGKILRQETIATQTPDVTMPNVLSFLQAAQQDYPFKAIGIGCFGPLDLNLESKNYGSITSTPKLAWRNFNICKAIEQHWQLPIGFDTDVTAAALAEGRWGAAKNLSDYIYITVGTGIGAGIISNGQPIHGAMHPEVGHMLIPRLHDDMNFAGVCPYHGCCLEGLAAGPALKDRWSVASALDLPKEHPAWEKEAHYLALGCVNLILSVAPQKIIMGGGVMKQYHLFALIRKKVQELLNNYIEHPLLHANIDEYIVPPQLQNQAGICGSIALASIALSKTNEESL